MNQIVSNQPHRTTKAQSGHVRNKFWMGTLLAQVPYRIRYTGSAFNVWLFTRTGPPPHEARTRGDVEGLIEGEGDDDGDCDGVSEGLDDGEDEGKDDGDDDAEGEFEGDGEDEGEFEGDGEAEGEFEGEGDKELDCDGELERLDEAELDGKGLEDADSVGLCEGECVLEVVGVGVGVIEGEAAICGWVVLNTYVRMKS